MRSNRSRAGALAVSAVMTASALWVSPGAAASTSPLVAYSRYDAVDGTYLIYATPLCVRPNGIDYTDCDPHREQFAIGYTDDRGARDHCPAISPNGEMVAYLRGPFYGIYGGFEVIVAGLDGSFSQVVLDEDKPGSAGLGCPTWSPNGTEILLTWAHSYRALRSGPISIDRGGRWHYLDHAGNPPPPPDWETARSPTSSRS